MAQPLTQEKLSKVKSLNDFLETTFVIISFNKGYR